MVAWKDTVSGSGAGLGGVQIMQVQVGSLAGPEQVRDGSMTGLVKSGSMVGQGWARTGLGWVQGGPGVGLGRVQGGSGWVWDGSIAGLDRVRGGSGASP